MENSDYILVNGLNSRFERNETFLEIAPDEETRIYISDSEDEETSPTSNYGNANHGDTAESRDGQGVSASRWTAWLDLICVLFLLFSIFHKWRRKNVITESVKVPTEITKRAFST